jgi:hypothetical protein
MAVALEAAQEVKKSSRRAKRTRDEEVTSGKPPGVPQAGWRLGRKPLWLGLALLGVVAAGLFVVLQIWRPRATGEADLRWNKVLLDEKSPCYAHLVSQRRFGQCVHNAKHPLRPRIYDWVKANVAVYTTAATPHPTPTLRDLSDAGQAEAIRFLELGSGLKGGAWADLQGTLNDSDAKVGERDPFRFDRTLIANVAKGVDWRPGDRMLWTRVLIQPINFKFAGYSVAETDNETQKVSSVEATASRKLSPEFSATIPGVEGPKVSLGASSERDVKMSSDITAQYEKLGIDITPDFLRIIRESERGLDAVGNTRVPLTVATDPEMIWRQYPYDKDAARRPAAGDPIVLLVTHFHGDGVDKPSDGDNPKPAIDDEPAKAPKPAIDILPQEPVPHCPLRARVWMLYEEHRVDRGREHYDEATQDVTLWHDAEDKQDVEVMSADEVSPAVWSLRLCEDALCAGKDIYFLMATVKTPDGAQNRSLWRKVVFTDYGVAIRVAHWLRMNHTNTPPNTDYRFNYPYASDYPYDAGRRYMTLAPLKTKRDDCHS